LAKALAGANRDQHHPLDGIKAKKYFESDTGKLEVNKTNTLELL
jgi:hypothetical protein